MMHRIATTEKDQHGFVIPYAEFHIGKAYFQGYGVPESEAQAQRSVESNDGRFGQDSPFSWWLLAASDAVHEPVIEAETALAFLYSRNSSPLYNMKKAYQWHSRASHDGSLESLGKQRNRFHLLQIDRGELTEL